ncbi:MAG: high-affinity branched-chain amino acid ABC transporter permease LivM [Rhodospirillales bacterium]|nr:high-affinity branched-chain amino acid ABC transporter permease LivM [Rhodospirillales bacterium]MCW9001500.1 high-affinity branched-chain amino acid ABC transporter permease LivM [Rhodospirillales bacterium]
MSEAQQSIRTETFNIPAALKDAFLTAFVMGALALPLAGFRIGEQGGAFFAEQRMDWVLIAVVAGFIGRFFLSLARVSLAPRIAPPAGAFFGGIGSWLHTNMVLMSGLAIIAAVILPFLPFTDRLILDRAIYMLIYVMLGWGLNIVVGLAGLLDLGYVAFYAVGAYSYALLSTHFELSFWICLPLAGLFAAGFGVILGFPVLRLRGDYLAIVTLGFGEIIRVILLNWYTVTNGPDGISGIARPSLFGLMEFTRNPKEGVVAFHEFFNIPFSGEHRMVFLYFLILALALITNFFTLRMRKLPVGRAWEALREDEIACRSLGINPTNVKLSAFAIGAMFAGFAGSFFATRQGFVSPESFTFIESAIILAIVVLGGMGSQIGVVIASFVLVLGPEFIRELQEYRMLAFGGLMVLIMMWRPRGLLAYRDPTIRLWPVKPKGARK